MQISGCIKIALITVLLCLQAQIASAATEIQWLDLGEDLQTTELADSVSSGIFQARFIFVRSSLKRYSLSVIRAEDFGRKRANVETLCNLAKGSACINANFFDEKGDPLGLVVNKANVYRKMHWGGKTLNGVFLSTRSGPIITNRAEAPISIALEAIQAGPILIENSKIVEGIRESSPASRRSGICINRSGDLLFFIATANFSKIPIEAVQAILKRPGIDCVSALNLDGGGSAQLFVNPNVGNIMSSYETLYIVGRDEVPVVLCLRLN